MEFNKENKVIIETMNREQAIGFVKFLKTEILRHERDIAEARDLAYHVCSKFKIPMEVV